MQIFHYHPETGAFLGSGLADPDPVDNTNWLIPAHATIVKPPPAAEGNVRVFRNGQWGYVREEMPDEEPEPEPQEPLPPTTADVDEQRDMRINNGFFFDDVRYQSGADDRENIAGSATAALAAIIAGAEPGDFRWFDPDRDFVWIAQDNSEHPMDAQTMFAFGKAAMTHKSSHIFAARALKDMDPIPSDYATNPDYWP